MTDAEIRRWLREIEHHDPVILVELDYMYQVGIGVAATPTVGTRRFTSDAQKFIDESGNVYLDAIAKDGVPKYERSLDRSTLSGKYSVTVGTLEISNGDGAHDDLLYLALDGSECRVYIGDRSWTKATFVQLFTALAVKAAAPSLNRISITLRDTGLLLNKNVGGDVAIGGTGANAQQYRPWIFGYVHNMKPVPIDATQYVYDSDGTNASAPVVRSNGIVLTGGGTDYTDNAGTGKFTLTYTPTAQEEITCDAFKYGTTATDYRLKDAISAIVGVKAGLTALGKYSGPDGTYYDSGATLNPLNDYHIGTLFLDKRNVLEWLNDACETGNIFYATDRLGNFRFGRIQPAAISAIVAQSGGRITIQDTLTEDDYSRGGPKLTHNEPAFVGYQSRANVNQVRQSTFPPASPLTAAQRAMLEREGLVSPGFRGEEPTSTQYLGSTVTYQGGAPQLYHKTLTDSQIVSTMISGASDTAHPDTAEGPAGGWAITDYTAAWSAVRRAKRLPWVEFVDGTVGLDRYYLEIGNVVPLQFRPGGSSRFNLGLGELHQVVSISINPSAYSIDLGIVRRRFAGVSGPLPSYELREDGGYELREDSGKELRE